ncbi:MULTISPECIES: hypothetical protein [Streptomyces]|uniref:DUF4232 domain-containing protein n=1 Tax=Streptomyces spinosisporus TaxID=2927582 RepID=A0ABS9XEQ0_9ACTN|nr:MULTISPECIES: hypothetical protein [Streptomyces]MCI3240511.1 hypothetical protein [Streptomyces spinosisporus]WUB37347.1 hypothetical protein OHN38_21495 [Streptomyces sp. NBC_00588]
MSKDRPGRESHERHEQEHTQPHAGNGTVNDGPDDQSPDSGLDSDELALRRMLHQAVQTVEPRDGALDHLRRAVPARRARKRQAAVGMAAAALFIGTAVPALLHVSGATGSDVNPSVAGQASQAQGGASQGKADGTEGATAGGSGKATDKGKGDHKGDGKGKGSSPGTGSSAGTGPAASSAAGASVCAAEQLGSPTHFENAPDSGGTVYGTFRVVNISTTPCSVGGPGTVSVLAQGSADPTKVGAQRHVSGDAAAGLPDPSTEVTGLLLQPGAAYEVKFAWVPSASCTPSGGDGGTGDGGPTSTPTPTEGTGNSAGSTSTGTESGLTTQLMRQDGSTDGTVTISHTTEAGSPTVSATISGACAGTVYYTGILPGT